MALVAGVALGAALVAVAPLVLVAGPADGEAALVAGGERSAVVLQADLVAADTAGLGRILAGRGAMLGNFKRKK